MLRGTEYVNTALRECPEGAAQDNFIVSMHIHYGGVIWCQYK